MLTKWKLVCFVFLLILYHLILLLLLAAIQAQAVADQLNQQAMLYAQQAGTGLSTRGGNLVDSFCFKLCIYFLY